MTHRSTVSRAFLVAMHYAVCAANANGNELPRVEPVEMLVNAAAQGDLASVRRQLTAGTDPNAASKSLNLALPLVQAAANGHGAVVLALLQSGAIIDARDGRGQRALVVAAYHGRLETCRQLLAAGARVAIAPMHADELTLLEASVMSGNVAVVELLLGEGAHLTRTDRRDRNALVIAVRMGHEKIVATLLNGAVKQADDADRDLLLLARDEAAQASRSGILSLIDQRMK